MKIECSWKGGKKKNHGPNRLLNNKGGQHPKSREDKIAAKVGENCGRKEPLDDSGDSSYFANMGIETSSPPR